MQEEGPPPELLRCNRTDGRQWRCNRPVQEGKKLCEVHYLQGRHRQHKEKVPESLKFVRRDKKISNGGSGTEANGGIRAPKGDKKLARLGKPVKRERSIGESEALDEALRKMKLKRGDLRLELIRMVLKREVEKKKQKKLKKMKKEKSVDYEGEFMRNLPNGVMAISSASPHSTNEASSCNVKIGAEPSTVNRRRFRSKNIEPLPVGTLKGVPFEANMVSLRKERRKRCHWCGKKSLRCLISCSSCRQNLFCTACIKQRETYSREEVEMACPVCRGTCGCNACSLAQCRDIECKDLLRHKSTVDRVLHFHYLICLLLPVLKRINQDQIEELEIEAKVKGQKASEVHIQKAELSCDKLCCCSNCQSSILDLHRSCKICSYNLCLSCCRVISEGSLPESLETLICKYPDRRKQPKQGLSDERSHESADVNYSASLPCWETHDGNVGLWCPSKEFGGCGDGFLDLRCNFPSNWSKNLETSAEEIVGSYELPETLDTLSCCSLCIGMGHEANGINQVQKAAVREDSKDNFLYYPTIVDIDKDNIDHFQKHWSQGQPVIVRNVLHGLSHLSWDPISMFCNYIKNSSAGSQNDKSHRATDSLDRFEVEIGIKQLFLGSLRGHTESNKGHEKLKMKGWLSSRAFQKQFPEHYAGILNALPLPDYMDPKSGLLNIATKLPEGNNTHPDLGPCVYIAYGSSEEQLPDSLTNLCFDFCDVVNILVHTTDAPVSTNQICNIRKLLKKRKDRERRKTRRQKMVNGIIEGSPSEEVHTDDRASQVSGNAVATNDACDSSLEDKHISDSGDTSEWDSDSDSDNSEPCLQKRELLGETTERETLGAQWDVFRRQDVPKLKEYIRKYCHEFRTAYGSTNNMDHPIFDQNLFLERTHLRRLKEEFRIEPWTFEQHLGEAVIVPAGCPYQIRKLKSCVNVVLAFVSPENVTECIQLSDELRQLPEGHKAKTDKLEVKRIAMDSISAAVKEIRELTCPQ